METIFVNPEELGASSNEYDNLGDSFYTSLDDGYDLAFEGQSDELSSFEPSYPSSSIPNSPGSSSSTTEPAQTSSPNVIFPNFVAEQQQMPEMPVIKREKVEPAVRPAPKITRQPSAKRSRSAATLATQPTAPAFPEAKIPDLLNPETLNNYMASLAKGKSEDIELFRNVLRCHGSLTPDIEKQLKHLARQVKNRESAQLSRQRKREYVQALKGVIDKMKSVDGAVRSELSSAQSDLAQYKAEAERWQNYANDLQRILIEHGIEVPKVPEVSVNNVSVPTHTVPQMLLPETLFDGPCGFGHMTPPKCNNSKRRVRAHKTKQPTKEV